MKRGFKDNLIKSSGVRKVLRTVAVCSFSVAVFAFSCVSYAWLNNYKNTADVGTVKIKGSSIDSISYKIHPVTALSDSNGVKSFTFDINKETNTIPKWDEYDLRYTDSELERAVVIEFFNNSNSLSTVAFNMITEKSFLTSDSNFLSNSISVAVKNYENAEPDSVIQVSDGEWSSFVSGSSIGTYVNSKKLFSSDRSLKISSDKKIWLVIKYNEPVVKDISNANKASYKTVDYNDDIVFTFSGVTG